MQTLVHIGLLYFVAEVKLFISIVLVLNIFLKKLKRLLGIKANIFRVKANDSIIGEYCCIGFIGFMLAGKTLVDFTSLLSPFDFGKNGDIILSYFKDE